MLMELANMVALLTIDDSSLPPIRQQQFFFSKKKKLHRWKYQTKKES